MTFPSPSHLAPAPAPAPRDPYGVPHRKNAAEWIMWIALCPFVPIARLIARVRAAKESGHG